MAMWHRGTRMRAGCWGCEAIRSRGSGPAALKQPGCYLQGGFAQKLQIPSAKLQTSSKRQIPNRDTGLPFGIWYLELAWNLALGTWNLWAKPGAGSWE